MAGNEKLGEGKPLSPPTIEPKARFGPSDATSINVQVNAQNLHINPSNLSALERIVQLNPDVAAQLVQVSRDAVKYERDRYKVGAICATVVCGLLLICASVAIVSAGFWAGIAFFLACVVAAAIIAAVFTGKVQDLSWTVGMMPGAKRQSDTPKNGDQAPEG